MFSSYQPLAVHPADGVQVDFPAPDLFYDVADINCVLITGSNEVPAVRGVDYTVSIIGREDTPPYRNMGVLRFVTPPLAGTNVVPFILPALVQDQGFEGRSVTPRQHERVHDRHVQAIAMLYEFFNRGYRSPLDTPAALRFIEAGRPGYVPTWDDLGNLVEGPTVADVNVVAEFIEQVVQVAAIRVEIAALVDIDTEIVGLYAVRAEIAALAPAAASIVILTPRADDIETLAPLAVEIAQVAAGAAFLETVAGIAAEVAVVADVAAGVQTVADNIAAILAAQGHAEAAAESETNAAVSAAAALASENNVALAGEAAGTIKMRFGALLPGFIAMGEGGTFNRATFPGLAAWLDVNGAELGLTAPQIAAGTLPDWRDYSPRTAGGALGPAVGALQQDAFQGHKMPMRFASAGAPADGIDFTQGAGGSGGPITNGAFMNSGVLAATGPVVLSGSPYSDGVNGTPRTAAETRVKSFGVRWQIKAFGAAVDQGTVVISALAAQVTDNTNRIAVLEAIGKPFTKEYVSAEQTITAGGLLSLTHGLGVVPKFGSVQLVCKIAESGYVPGQRIEMGAIGRTYSTESNGFTYASDTTTITIKQGATGTGQLIIPTGGSIAYITAANWRFVVRAWA